MALGKRLRPTLASNTPAEQDDFENEDANVGSLHVGHESDTDWEDTGKARQKTCN
jgi:hypothetical protein